MYFSIVVICTLSISQNRQTKLLLCCNGNLIDRFYTSAIFSYSFYWCCFTLDKIDVKVLLAHAFFGSLNYRSFELALHKNHLRFFEFFTVLCFFVCIIFLHPKT